MRPDLVVAPQARVIRTMMTPYLDELTTGSLTVYPQLSLYWEDADRFPYLIRVSGTDVGFALVRRHVTSGFHEMAEFYVAPEHRRRGCGREAARALFARHPGWWHLQILDRNAGARAFWARVIDAPVRATAQQGSQGRPYTVLQFRAGDTA